MNTKDTKVKLNPEVEKLIFDAAMTANSVGVEAFVIDEEGIRGMDDDQNVVILKTSFKIKVPFDAFAVGDVKQFVQRYNAHNNNEPVSITITIDSDLITKIVTFKSKGLNIDYRCLAPKRVKAPKKLLDESHCSFEMTEEALEMLKRGSVIMKSDVVLFVKEEKEDFVRLVITDINKSVFEYEIDGKVEAETDLCTFANLYPIKYLLGAIKGADDNFIDIGLGKSLSVQKNGINIIIPPRK